MSPHPSQEEPLQRLTHIVNSFLQRPDIGPFREPVDWRGLELHDYPKIIKKMMDLGTVKRKLERKQYYTAAECADDIRLIWSNCMTYNADGSDFWLLAKSFARRFEDRYRKIRQECKFTVYGIIHVYVALSHGFNFYQRYLSSNNVIFKNYCYEVDVGVDLTPDGKGSENVSSSKASKDSKGSAPNSPAGASYPLDARAKFGANLFLLSGIELAHVIMTLERECPQALEYVKEEVQVTDDPNESEENKCQSVSQAKVEINVDEITHQVFQELSSYVSDKVGTKGHSDVKMQDITSGGSSRPKKKKQRK